MLLILLDDAIIADHSQPSALVIVKPKPLFTDLLEENPVLLAEVVNRQQLALVHPAGDHDQHESEWFKDSLHAEESIIPSPSARGSSREFSSRSSSRAIRRGSVVPITGVKIGSRDLDPRGDTGFRRRRRGLSTQ